MIYATISACALALVAVVCAALAWITSSRRTLELRLAQSLTDRSLTEHATRLESLARIVSELKSTAPSSLAAEVVELSDAVARLAKTQQRFAGTFYARTKAASRSEPNGADVDIDIDDPELQAELALQRAAPVAPGRT